MKPYYDHGGITIYHGDCREILPSIKADVMVTDPPYGIDANTRGWSAGRSVAGVARDWPAVRGDDEPFNPAHLLALGLPTVLWGANHYADSLPRSPSWFVWYKRTNGIENDSADAELAWTNLGGPARVFHHPWMGMLRASEKGEAYHPTQKPVVLMLWCLRRCPDGDVLDPYMGGGSTLRAAKDLGRKAIGIEIEERYCEIAAKRLAQEVFSFS